MASSHRQCVTCNEEAPSVPAGHEFIKRFGRRMVSARSRCDIYLERQWASPPESASTPSLVCTAVRRLFALVAQLAIDHNSGDVAGVFERVAIIEYDVCIFAGFERAHTIGDAKNLCRINRRSAQCAFEA